MTATASSPHVLMAGAYPEWDMAPLQAAYTLHRLWEAPDRAAFVAEHAADIRAIATRGELGASAELIAALPRLELIACYGVGTDAIDLAACRARGIRVSNTPDVLNGDVADLAVGLTLALQRRIPAGDQFVRSGAWANGALPLATRVFGQRIGIAGFGRIGGTIARRLSGFDVELGYFSRNPKADSPHRHFASLSAMADWCDVLIVILPGGEATRGIVDAEVLQALGPKGWLVNVSRGTTVDEGALLQALQTRSIAGAALDVFLNEPRIDPRFAALDNVVLTPHHGSGTEQTRRAMGELVRRNLEAHFAGQPLITPVA
ncbi:MULTISPECIES: 2-hydroxyacid dehydrogenase [unclassified Variovorax]|uniref:2-hydroxyacid dehydrogenase n=1 Tax=unclassified Variovorax TaxID=663243 RepID=UPI0008B38997|nr:MULTISPECIES: 2-hydroxyacid dehydrogenase [unclassified Variovorax]SEK16890.1 D-3-phosphoglycerate dehydrogenase [Variovorax sp. OK202]SFE63814.1 D-3-phosphoglycerate dehydrogenase [Variovorax sp. OK212]